MARTAPVRHVLAKSAAAEVTELKQMTDSERAALAEKVGFRSIGKELPDGVTLQDIIKSLPPSVFEINPVRAWSAVFIALASFSACLYLISVSPWYLLPFAWALAGTSFTGVRPQNILHQNAALRRVLTPSPPLPPPPLPPSIAVLRSGP